MKISTSLERYNKFRYKMLVIQQPELIVSLQTKVKLNHKP